MSSNASNGASHKMGDAVQIQLSTATVFPDLNKSEGKPEDFARDELLVKRLKFKHFREMNTMPQEQQMIFAISRLTGLSQDDVDELYAEDAAKITEVIISFMQSFMNIAQNLMKNNPNMPEIAGSN